MKLTGTAVERFLARPDPAVQVVLLYGPDHGLVRERANRLAAHVVDDLNDPFRVAELTPQILDDDPARLADEAAAIAMLGGRRVVRLRPAGDRQAKLIAGFLDQPAGDALIVIEAGDLPGPRSELRRVVEGADNGAAIACYPDTAASLDALIDQVLGAAGLTVDGTARAWLAEHLGADRAVSRGELDKLVLYVGSAATEVTIEDCRAAVGDASESGIDDIVEASLGGNLAALERAITRGLARGDNPVSILRAVIRQVLQLQLARHLVDDGTPVDRALMQLKPPVRFPRDRTFKAALMRWSAPRLAEAVDLLAEAELDAKTTGNPAETLTARALMRLAGAARAGSRR